MIRSADPPRSIPALACAAIFACAAAAAAGESVEVSADRMRIDARSGRASFEGNVRLALGDLVVECDSVEAGYDRAGALVSFEATGGVVVRKGAARATARSARLEARGRRLVLEGGPVLVQGEQRLEGERILVHLDTGRLEVERARGLFKLNIGEAE